jgi:hypothetical protein
VCVRKRDTQREREREPDMHKERERGKEKETLGQKQRTERRQDGALMTDLEDKGTATSQGMCWL